ncbi:MAG TPA: glycoside hydrolase family 44 protein [Opitutaceae bacterium]
MTPSRALPLVLLFGVASLHADNAVSIAINPAAGRIAISPYIYGSNQDLPGVNTLGARRYGGNRLTGYNWETNASNAGTDYINESDNFLVSSLPQSEQSTPGIALTQFHDQTLSTNCPYSVLTLQMAGYVSADESGPVTASQAAPSSRWDAVVNNKPGGQYADPPNTSDSVVYMDELLNFLLGRYGPASGSRGVKGYDLDNEPDLWSSTHPYLHPAQPTCAEIVGKTVALATTVKRMDPSAQVLGPVSYGSEGYFTFQNAPDWATIQSQNSQYRWFLDYYLDQLSKASATAEERLLDVFDLHRYSDDGVSDSGEWPYSTSITDQTDFTITGENQERVQAPRVLWDPTFHEKSWVQLYDSQFLPWIPNLQKSITTFYPGTKLSFTEYSYGGESDISGGIAQADVLGILGKYGVFLGCIWPLHSDVSYLAPAFNLYLNYDGAGSQFGSTSVHETDSDTVNTSAYSSVDGAGNLHVIVINKNFTTSADLNFLIAGPTQYSGGSVYAFDGSSKNITARTGTTANNNTVTYTLPPLTAAHFVFPRATAQSATQGYLANLSARADTSPTLGVGDELGAGFVTTGSGSKTVLLRGIGPALAGYNISNFVTEPTLSLYSGSTLTGSFTAGWNSNLQSVFSAVGAFSLATGSDDQASEQTFTPGSYTAYVSSANNQDGVALLELYDADNTAPANRLINLSTRSYVGTGANSLVAGFYVAGQLPEEVLIRGIGPGLAQYGVTGTLPAPQLQVYDSTSNTLIASIQGWGFNPTAGPSTAAVAYGAATVDIMNSVYASSIPSGGGDSAMVLTLLPGHGYTAVVSGSTGGTGVALVEVYEVP